MLVFNLCVLLGLGMSIISLCFNAIGRARSGRKKPGMSLLMRYIFFRVTVDLNCRNPGSQCSNSCCLEQIFDANDCSRYCFWLFATFVLSVTAPASSASPVFICLSQPNFGLAVGLVG